MTQCLSLNLPTISCCLFLINKCSLCNNSFESVATKFTKDQTIIPYLNIKLNVRTGHCTYRKGSMGTHVHTCTHTHAPFKRLIISTHSSLSWCLWSQRKEQTWIIKGFILDMVNPVRRAWGLAHEGGQVQRSHIPEAQGEILLGHRDGEHFLLPRAIWVFITSFPGHTKLST